MATLEQVIDAIIAEAAGEGDVGLAAVAWSMQNRATERGKPITAVVDGGSYSGLSNPGEKVREAQRDPQMRTRARTILEGVQSGRIPDMTGGATHYWSPKGMRAAGKGDPYWADEEASRFGRHQIGGHVFLPKRQPAPIPTGDIIQMAAAAPPPVPQPRPTSLMAYAPQPGGTASLPPFPSDAPPLPRSRPGSPNDVVRGSFAALTPTPRQAPRQPRAADLSLTDRNAATPHLRTNGRGIVDPSSIVFGQEMETDIFSASSNRTPQAQTPTRSAAEMASLYRSGGPTRPASSRTAPTPRPAADAFVARSMAAARNKDADLEAALQTWAGGSQRPADYVERSMAAVEAANPRRTPQRPAADLAMTRTNPMTPRLGADGRGAYSPQLPMNADNFSGGLASLTPNAASLRRPTRPTAPAPRPLADSVIARTNANLPQQDPTLRTALANRSSSPVGGPPTTRVVQSVPVPRPSLSGATRTANAPLAGQVALPPGVRPQVPDLSAPQHPRIGGASVMDNYAYQLRTAQRLTPNMPSAAGNMPALPGSHTPQQVAQIGTDINGNRGLPGAPFTASGVNLPPLPMPLSMRPPAPFMPPLPIPRPGIGGPVAANPRVSGVAPTPMPRLQRGGIFGRPRIFGHDVQLPGILGLIQGATTAMNNASGPHSNGADNWIYNRMRGGDFNTRGAATMQGGGFLWAPNRNGGPPINVGRVNPRESGAALYDRLNAPNRRPTNAAERMEQNSTRYDSGGGMQPRGTIF